MDSVHASHLKSLHSTLTASVGNNNVPLPPAVVKSIHASLTTKPNANDVSHKTELKRSVGKFTKLLNVALMFLVLLMFGMNNSLFAPFFPTEAERRGVSATTVGFVFGTFTFTLFIGSLVGGLLVPVLGLHFMIGSGTLLAGGSTILFGFLDLSPPGDAYIVLCFLIRIVEGLGASLYTIAVYSIAAVLFKDNISSSYAALEAAIGAGSMVGPTLGGALFSAGGFPLPFFVVGAMLLAFGFISQVVLRLTLPQEMLDEAANGDKKQIANNDDSKQPKQPTSWLYFFRNSFEIWILNLSIALSALAMGFTTPTLALHLAEIGLDDAVTVGFIFLGGAAAYTVFSLISGKIADLLPKHHFVIMACGGGLITLGYFFMGPVPMLKGIIPSTVGGTIACYMANGAGLALVVNPTPAAIQAAARAVGYQDNLETSAMVASLFNAQWYIGSCAGTPLAGVLLDNVGFYWGTFTVSMLALSMTIMLIIGGVMHKLKTSRLVDPYNFARFKGGDSVEAILSNTPSLLSSSNQHLYGSTTTGNKY